MAHVSPALPLALRPSSITVRSRLVGRRETEETLGQLLESGVRLVVLLGAAGVGKTALARTLVRTRRAQYVSLEACKGRRQVLSTLARALGATVRSGAPQLLLAQIGAHASDRTLLIDDVDRCRVNLRTLLEPLLDAAPTLSLVVCSRVRIGTSMDHVLHVPPLARIDALALLRARVHQQDPRQELTDADANALVDAAGGLPLALEVIASRVATLGPAVVHEALVDGSAGDGLGLHELDTAIATSWRFLPPRVRSTAAALCVFQGTFSLDHARALLDRATTLGDIETLLAMSFLSREIVGSQLAIQVPHAIAGYVRRQPLYESVSEAAQKRHAELFADGLVMSRADDPATWLELEHLRTNLLAAWRWAVERDGELAARLALRLDPLLITQGPHTLHRTLFEQTLDTLQSCPPSPTVQTHLVDLHLTLGRIHALRGHHSAALQHYESALKLATMLHDVTRMGWSAGYLCFSLRPLGRTEASRARGNEARKLAKDDPRLMAMAEQALGCTELAAGNIAEGLQHQRRAVLAARSIAAPRLEAIALANLALAHAANGDRRDAEHLLAQSRILFVQVSDRFHLARLRVHELTLALETQDLACATTQLEEALCAVRAQGDFEGEYEARLALLYCATLRGEHALAKIHEVACRGMEHNSDSPALMPSAQRLYDLVFSDQTPAKQVRLSRDGSSLYLGDAHISLRRRGPLRRVLVTLVDNRLGASRALSVRDLMEAGWPEEKMRPESASARVYMAVRRLRSLGLDIETLHDGYALASTVPVSWLSEG